ncbi:hypothetical protein NDU88_002040 [Pleurodeles waltl]|uniref:Uncharacterized protein n=1 Tax=Pleurodeles waltl TaxID=8319 RepID=A0AAV7S9A2_PLEWA|nr:hypothetical protein NDU88_002040 [Pleurodeles waltl]
MALRPSDAPGELRGGWPLMRRLLRREYANAPCAKPDFIHITRLKARGLLITIENGLIRCPCVSKEA